MEMYTIFYRILTSQLQTAAISQQRKWPSKVPLEYAFYMRAWQAVKWHTIHR